MAELDSAKQKELAQRAVKDIMQLARFYGLPDGMIMNNDAIRKFCIAVYQAGAKMAIDETCKIEKKAFEKTAKDF